VPARQKAAAREERGREESGAGRAKEETMSSYRVHATLACVTVAILAQGTHWAMQLCKPFLLWARSPRVAPAEGGAKSSAHLGPTGDALA